LLLLLLAALAGTCPLCDLPAVLLLLLLPA
jgi:hypothetical protein